MEMLREGLAPGVEDRGDPNRAAEVTRVYALLWSRDQDLNPSARVATTLTLAYPTGDVPVAVPSPGELAALEQDLVTRSEAARRSLAAESPEAKPSLDNCSFCGVKQLCDDYWTVSTQRLIAGARPPEKDGYRDVEVMVTGRHGNLSWDAVVQIDGAAPKAILVRSSAGDLKLQPGGRARMLDVHVAAAHADQSDLAILTVGGSSEVYELP